MIKIAVCGCDFDTYSKITIYIKKVVNLKYKKISVDYFKNNSEFLQSLNSGDTYEILFLNGVLTEIKEFGNYIRDDLNNQTIGIVYLVNSEDNIIILMESHPLSIIKIPITEKKISDIISLFEKVYNDKKLYFKIKNGKDFHFILCKDIIYITSEARKLNVITFNGNYSCYGKINDIEKLSGFIKIHKSYIININYIKKYNYISIEMKNGDIVPISQAFRPKIKKMIERL